MIYDILGHPLLSEKYDGLEDEDIRDAVHSAAELLLGLRAPAYTGQDAIDITYALVTQINFLLEQDIAPDVLKSVSNSHPGIVTQYRDRYRSNRAYELVALVTGVKQVRFEVPGRGV
jgi:hypothetical protein